MSKKHTKELFEAVESGKVTAIRAALKKGAKINEVLNGETPLLFAVSREKIQYKVVKELLKEGASVNTPDSDGRLPLDALALKFAEQGRARAIQSIQELIEVKKSLEDELEEEGVGKLGNVYSQMKDIVPNGVRQGNERAVTEYIAELLLEAGALESSKGLKDVDAYLSRDLNEIEELYSILEKLKIPYDERRIRNEVPHNICNAASKGKLKVVDEFLENGADINARAGVYESALACIAGRGDVEMAGELIKRGADVNDFVLKRASESGNVEMIGLLSKSATGLSEKNLASYKERAKQVTSKPNLLGKTLGAAVKAMGIATGGEKKGQSLSDEERTELSKRACDLISTGTLREKVDAVIPNDSFGLTPMILACQSGLNDIVSALIKAGASVNGLPSNEAHVPLEEAAEGGYIQIIKLLLDASADPNRKNHLNGTAVIAAAERGEPELVKLLLEAGADPVVVTDGGETAHILARGPKAKEIKEILSAAAKKREKKAGKGSLKTAVIIKKEPKGKKALVGVASFFDYASGLGNGEYIIRLVKAPVEKVSALLAKSIDSVSLETDVAKKLLDSGKLRYFLIELDNSPWTIIPECVGHISRFRQELPELSAQSLSKITGYAVAELYEDDTVCVPSVSFFDEGERTERFSAEPDGKKTEVTHYAGKASKPEKFKVKEPEYEFLNSKCEEAKITVPPLYVESDGFRAQLVLTGVPAKQIKRVDYLYVPE